MENLLENAEFVGYGCMGQDQIRNKSVLFPESGRLLAVAGGLTLSLRREISSHGPAGPTYTRALSTLKLV